MFYLIFIYLFICLFYGQKREMTHQSRDQSLLNVLVRFQSTFFVTDWHVFTLLSTIGCTVLSLSNYYSIIKAEPDEN